MTFRNDRIAITYELTFDSPFHCGTGVRESLIDRTVVKDRYGYLYIPGSTFKGVLRERCEQLARFYEVVSDEMLELIASPHDMDAALRGLGSTMTMITRIFGSHISPSTLYFDDARMTDTRQYDARGDNDATRDNNGKRAYLSTQTDIYTQVRLDRPTRIAATGALYTSEFGVHGLRFEGHITGTLACFSIDDADQGAPTYSLLLLLAGLRLVDRLGGNKSTGKGQCACKITKFQVDDREYSREEWEAWFEKLDELSFYSSMVEGSEA